jgi:hypothetical protein
MGKAAVAARNMRTHLGSAEETFACTRPSKLFQMIHNVRTQKLDYSDLYFHACSHGLR